MREKKKVLFLCTHNSSRSQMAEGILRALYGKYYEVYSAGTKPTKVHPYAIEVMKEIGIDISQHKSKGIKDLPPIEFDYVITVCDRAKEECPFFPGGKKYLHRSFEDPSQVEEEKLKAFRKVRDEIKTWIIEVLGKDQEEVKKDGQKKEKNKTQIVKDILAKHSYLAKPQKPGPNADP